MSAPLPAFSPWIGWYERKLFASLFEKNGVYVLARFESTPGNENANPLAKEVVYIGKAAKQLLTERLGDFEAAAFHGGNDHNGGKRYAEKFPNDDGAKLCLAIYPPANARARVLESNIDYVEKECVKRYKQLHHHYPLCNEIMPPG